MPIREPYVEESHFYWKDTYIHGIILLIWSELELLSFYYNKVPFFSVLEVQTWTGERGEHL